ncbi:sugar ABC transporter permease [Parablautia intestinalis]|uniref:Sugar ABC transporter permease n=2 Tax=Parablautia intestinalis TaxID=2320100 RepID=A0A3A9AKZ0_9FIRM|nr:sugar ABC transporter permease [Lachnospiraceae bacterium]RKI88081.1 sugar ABC transporter permease [Parablautia intestinalis]
MTKKRNKKFNKNTLSLFLIALPGCLYLLINNYIPIMGIFVAFKNYSYAKGIWDSPWCGFSNFKFLFITNDAWTITRNTLLYNLAFIVLGTIMSVFLAILLHELGEQLRGKFFQSTLLFPHLLSWVVTAYLVYALLGSSNGFVNNTLLGKDNAIDWYSAKAYWPVILVLVYLWKNAGYTAIVYMAGIAGIDKEIFEAAQIDGAGKVKQIFSITLPMLRPTVIIMTLMSIGRIFYSDFGLFYQVPMNSGALFQVTQTIDTYVYRGLMEQGNIAMSSAAGVYQSMVGFVLVVLANFIVKKKDPENALF